ncbi:hypothetical protein D9M68_693030 [compost metagenome]
MASGSGGSGASSTSMHQSSANSADCTNSCACHSSAAHRPWWSRMLGRRSVMMRPTLSTAFSIRRLMFWHLQRMRVRMSSAASALRCACSARRLSIQLTSIFSATSRLPSSSCTSRAMRVRSSSRTDSDQAASSRTCLSAVAKASVRSLTRSSSWSLACCSASAARLRSVMSTKVTTAPRTRPSSTMGWLEYSTGKAVPSRRQNTSLSMRQGRPWRKALKIGHSASG